jgi:hypothetical protein
VGAACYHSAGLALATAAIFTEQCGSKCGGKITATRARRSREKPSVVNTLVAVFDCDFKLCDSLGLTCEVIPDWHRS